MNQNRARDNELQRAIDEITRKAAPVPGTGMPAVEPKPANGTVPPVPPVPPVAEPKPPVPPMPPMGGVKPAEPAKPVESAKPEAEVGNSLPPVKPVSAPVPPSVSSIVAGAQPKKPLVERRDDQRDRDNRPEMKRPLGQSNADVQSIKEAALKELFPIMNRIELKPEKRFELYCEMMEVMKDKAILKPAHEAAKEIKDEKARADALIYLIETIEKLD